MNKMRRAWILAVVAALGGLPILGEPPSALEALPAAEVDFRGCDRGGGRIEDFWAEDVGVLYGIEGVDAPATPER